MVGAAGLVRRPQALHGRRVKIAGGAQRGIAQPAFGPLGDSLEDLV